MRWPSPASVSRACSASTWSGGSSARLESFSKESSPPKCSGGLGRLCTLAGINRSPWSSRRKPAGSLQFPKRCSGGAPVDIEAGKVKLTDLASCGGCAAKYSAARLEELLAGFVPVEAENLLVGLAPADDAA